MVTAQFNKFFFRYWRNFRHLTKEKIFSYFNQQIVAEKVWKILQTFFLNPAQAFSNVTSTSICFPSPTVVIRLRNTLMAPSLILLLHRASWQQTRWSSQDRPFFRCCFFLEVSSLECSANRKNYIDTPASHAKHEQRCKMFIILKFT